MAIDKKELIRAVKVFNKDRDVDDKIPTDLEDRDMMEKFVEMVNKVNEDGGDIPEKCVEVYNSEWLQGAMAGEDEVVEETEVENEEEEINEMDTEKTEETQGEVAEEAVTEVEKIDEELVKEGPPKTVKSKGKGKKVDKKKGATKVEVVKEATPKTTKGKKGKERETVSSFDTSKKATNVKAAKEEAKKKTEEKKAASVSSGTRNKSVNKLSVRVEGSDLLVEFKAINKSEKFKLPSKKEDFESIKKVFDNASVFATKYEATQGQLDAIRKAMGGSGFYRREKKVSN